MYFQDLIERLNKYWTKVGLLIGQPYGIEVGAGTGNPNTFFRVLGPEPFSIAYVEPSRRPADGRYGENPNRLQHYFQYQIILKPAPSFHLDLYLGMLSYIGIDPFLHDIRFIEDNWASPSLRAWGLGWEIWLDSMEVTQYTYFQQMGGYNLSLPTVEITLGLERLAMYIQNIDDYKDLQWNKTVKYGDLFKQHEYYQSLYNFEQASVPTLFKLIDLYFSEIDRLIKIKNFWVAYDYVLKVSHTFNILDARGVTSAEYRRDLFNKLGNILNKIADLYVQSRKLLNYPLQYKSWNIKKIPNVFKKLDDLESIINKVETSKNFKDFDLNKSFLLELGFEDLPLEVLQELEGKISRILDRELSFYGISVKKKEIILTSKRIGFVLEKPILKNSIKIIKGPKKDLVLDNSGKYNKLYTKIIEKYSNTVKTEFKEGFLYIYVKNTINWINFIDSLTTNLFKQLPFKHMNYSGKHVIRPLRSIIAFLNSELLDLSELKLTSFNLDYKRNRLLIPTFLGGGNKMIKDVYEYKSFYDKFTIILNPTARLNYIIQEVQSKYKLNVITSRLQKKLRDVSMLVESANVYHIDLPSKYLSLPKFLIDYILWKNQKFISINRNTFLVIANNPFKNATSNILKGALKVSVARLEDGLFYFTKDKDTKLEDIINKSQKINIGARKLQSIKLQISNILGVIREIMHININSILNKHFLDIWHADLATQLGREFPTLSGKILSFYIKKSWIKYNNEFEENKELLSLLLDLSYYLENQDFKYIERRFLGRKFKNIEYKDLIRDFFLFYISVFIDDILYSIKKYGLPKGASDKYGIKNKIDGLYFVLKFLYQYFKLNINIQDVLYAVFDNYNIRNVTLQALIYFLKRRLFNYIYKNSVDIIQKSNNSKINTKLISAFTFAYGIKIPLIDFRENKKNIRINYDDVYIILKRIYNLIKIEAANLFTDYQYINSKSFMNYLEKLFQELINIAQEYKENLERYDNEALSNVRKVFKNFMKSKIYSSFSYNNFINLFKLLLKINDYIDNVTIHGDKKIHMFRQKLLLFILSYSFLFINILAWLGQDSLQK